MLFRVAALSLIFCFSQWFSSVAWAFNVPTLTDPVMDQSGILDFDTKSKLNEVLKNPDVLDKIQLQILVVNSLQEESIESVSIQITDKWKLGTAKKDNGVLFLIAPKERKLRIEVGQGLEGDLPDAIAKRIISDVVTPYFKQGMMSQGITAGTLEILKYAGVKSSGIANNNDIEFENVPRQKISLLFWIIIFIVVLIFRTIFFGGGPPRGGYRGGRGGFGGGWGGSGGFGGGGGWSGGGGGFSGGGSSGSW